MGKYEQDARLLLEYVGGKENIAAVSHCVSRMRFVLNDPAKADVAKIESLKSAKGTFTQAGQFQVIIGNTVNDFYNDFILILPKLTSTVMWRVLTTIRFCVSKVNPRLRR